MATKYLEILSTRHTPVGTFRFGMIYKVDDTERRMADVIKSLTNKGTEDRPKNPAAKLLTQKQAAAAKAAVESLVPKEDPENSTDAALRAKGDVDDKLAKAKKDMAELVQGLKKAKADIHELTQGIEAERQTVADLTEKLTVETARADAAEKALADALKDAKG